MKIVLFLQLGHDFQGHLKFGGMLRAAKEYGWHVQVIRADDSANLRKLERFWHPAGIVIDCGSESHPGSRKTSVGVPIVYIGRNGAADWKNSFRVELDSQSIGETAARELLSLNLPHYAFVGDFRSCWWSSAREGGFAAALAINGFGYSSFPIPPGQATPDTRKLIVKLQDWLAALPRPCGIFASDDATADTLRFAIASAGFAIPTDFAIVGADDDKRICENAHPSLTSISIDFELAGYLAGQFLHERLNGAKPRNRCRTFPAKAIVRRESTARPQSPRPDQAVTAMFTLIRREACNGLTAADAIRASGLNRRVAELRFRKACGHSVLDEIQNVRLERAQTLLGRVDVPIGEIAAMCGYASADHFRRIFRKKTGRSPAVWRKSGK